MKLKSFYIGILALLYSASVAHTQGMADYQMKLDSTDMLLGGQQYLYISCKDSLITREIDNLLDTLSWLSILEKENWKSDRQNFSKKILFSVFDSGVFKIPLQISSEDGPGTSLFLRVYYPLDSLSELRLIKPIEETSAGSRMATIILMSLLILLLILFVLWQFFKADKAHVLKLEHTSVPKPWEIAWNELDALDREQLWQKAEIKLFYDRLSNIVRKFLSDGLFIPAIEHTTSDIHLALNEKLTDREENDQVIRLLTTSDLVKFANKFPAVESHEEWLKTAKAFVKNHREQSEQLSVEHRKHFLAILGEKLANQFEDPMEIVPDVLAELYESEKKLEELNLFTGIFTTNKYQLPANWIAMHHRHTGRFYKWQNNLFSSETNRLIRILMFLISMPVIAIFTPVLYVVSLWNKESMTARGIFAVGKNDKIVLRKIPVG